MTSPNIEVYLTDSDLREELRKDVLEGFRAKPWSIPPKWFYDTRGSDLFEQITQLPEYYPTRREREILEQRAHEIATMSKATSIVELGSGSSGKTRVLLDAFSSALRRFTAFDVSESALRQASLEIYRDYPKLQVNAVVGDFERHLSKLPAGGEQMIVFLGGTIGNFEPGARAQFLRTLVDQMSDTDGLLLGADLIKDIGRLEAAYNDTAGVTAEFNRNILRVINNVLKADFVPECFEHLAWFDAENVRIEMNLTSGRNQSAHVLDLDLAIDFVPGDRIRTEISTKFSVDSLTDELETAGLCLKELWTDPAGDFALSWSVPG